MSTHGQLSTAGIATGPRTHPGFIDYYAHASVSAAAARRFVATRDLVLRFLPPGSRLLDGSVTNLPWESGSMDVWLVPQLLEHVEDWRSCLDEAGRVLRSGGALFLATTNRRCPRRQEFSLPLYGGYPGPVKRRSEQFARTTGPDVVGYATHPVVNWFTFDSLRRELQGRGFEYLDRFDAIDLTRRGRLAAAVVRSMRTVPALRWLGHVAMPATVVVALKTRERAESAGTRRVSRIA